MSTVKSLKIAGIQIMEVDGKIDWGKFKNTPATIVSAAGHNHDTVHYTSAQTDTQFNNAISTLMTIQAQIDNKAIKYMSYIGGGVSGGNGVRKYVASTQTCANLGALLTHSPTSTPGITSKEQGYITNANQVVTKFTYSTQTAADITSCPITVGASLFDFAIQTKGLITNGTNWAQLDTLTDAWELKTNATVTYANRPMLSSSVFGFTKATGTNTAYLYNYSTGVSSASTSFTINGVPTGLNRNSSYGYWIADTNSNLKHSYVTSSVITLSLFTLNFSNASTLTTEFDGYSISGSNQAGIQKINWSTEVIASAGSVDVDLTGGSAVEA
jgi:hypothetical protein